MSGPFDFTELDQRGIKPTEKVWWEGLSDWIPSTEVPELAQFIREKTTRTTTTEASQPKGLFQKIKRAIGFQ